MKVLVKGALLLAASAMMVSSVYAKGMELESMKANTVNAFDVNDAVWAKVKSLVVVLDQTPYKPDGFKGITKTTATLKSVYDDKNMYLYMQYDDPTMSDARFPWEKQADGSWKKLVNKDQTGHENNFYEDKAAVYFDINAKGFAKKGCAIACHITKDGMNNGFADTSAGRKYTRKAGETIDMWHWKGVRTGMPFKLTHDQYVDDIADPAKDKNWGRHGDEKLGGGYKDNGAKGATAPEFMNPNGEFMNGFVLDATKVPFVDTFKAGDRVPGIVVSKMSGSAADIETNHEYKDGKWTLVFKRALVTEHPKSKVQDVQFSDLKKPYYFGVSVFDNTQINHMYHDGSIKLLFK